MVMNSFPRTIAAGLAGGLAGSLLGATAFLALDVLMPVLNLNNVSAHLGLKSCVTLRRLHRKGQLDDYRRVGPDKRAIFLETHPYGLPYLREHVQKHTACCFDSPLCQAPSWTEVTNGYLDFA